VAPRPQDRRHHRTLALVGAALLVAAASLPISHGLRFDPQGWLRWGREIGLGDGAFDTSVLPSWKPLPLLVAVPLAVAGPAAPWLWLLLARTAGLMSLGLLYRLTARQAGPPAGVVAAGLLALTPAWWTTLLGGGIEPVIVALGCAAVAAHRAGRPVVVLALLTAMVLGREEALLLVAAYGVTRGRRWWALTAVATGAIVAAWLGGDWLGSGDPLHGGALARAAGAADPPVHVPDAGLVAAIVLGPQLLALAALGATTAWRAGDRLIPGLAASALGWTAMDLTLVALGYPLPARFLLPAAAAAAAAVGVGLVALGGRPDGAPFRRRSAPSAHHATPMPR
jgi:hypothetical protein